MFDTNWFENCPGLLNCLSVGANNVTYGMFWTIINLSFAIVLFMATSRFGASRAFGFATFGSGVVAILLVLARLMPWYIASFFIILLGLGVVVMRMSER